MELGLEASTHNPFTINDCRGWCLTTLPCGLLISPYSYIWSPSCCQQIFNRTILSLWVTNKVQTIKYHAHPQAQKGNKEKPFSLLLLRSLHLQVHSPPAPGPCFSTAGVFPLSLSREVYPDSPARLLLPCSLSGDSYYVTWPFPFVGLCLIRLAEEALIKSWQSLVGVSPQVESCCISSPSLLGFSFLTPQKVLGDLWLSPAVSSQ